MAIAAVIGLNVVTMAMEFYKMPKVFTHSYVSWIDLYNKWRYYEAVHNSTTYYVVADVSVKLCHWNKAHIFLGKSHFMQIIISVIPSTLWYDIYM